jgi:pantothenate kinase
MLRRLRAETEHTVFAPGFDRELEQPLAAAIAVDPEVAVVITEGNYLLVDQEPWVQVRDLLDEVVFVQLDGEERRRRLRARHEQFGKSSANAHAWVEAVDEPNAVLVAATAARADRLLRR